MHYFNFVALVVAIGLNFPHASLADEAETDWRPPKFESLPSSAGLPDQFTFADGTKVESAHHWQRRREEIKAMLLYYQYGRIPPRPDRVTATLEQRKLHKSGLGTEEWITLSIDSKHQLPMRMVVYVPNNKSGPFPVVIREEGTLGRTQQIPMFLRAGYMFIEYARHDLDPDRYGVVGPAQQAYPDYDWATLAVWAWGGMRVVDYLETRSDVDMNKIAITGHSRGGKMALLAGALDERFSLVVPNGSGAGGAGSYRVLGPGAESLAMNDKPHWYHPRIRQFAEKEDRLPFDQHFLKALVAPRALLCTESVDDLFANPLGTQVTSQAVQQVYEFLGAETTRNGLHYRSGKHDSNTDDWQALLEFAQWHFVGTKPRQPERFWQTPFPNPLEKQSAENHGRHADASPAIAERRQSDSFPPFKFVPIGDPNNTADAIYFDDGRFGQVALLFEISQQQISNRQYAAFLNAVARSDAHGLFHLRMQTDPAGGISRYGKPGEFLYELKPGAANKPVNFVDWHDAVRFCNWLHNGRPTGGQTAATTEDGAYTLDGTSDARRRNGSARYYLPSEDEWYKAAYFAPTLDGGNYHLFRKEERGRLSVIDRPANWVSPYRVTQLTTDRWEWTDSHVGELFRGLRTAAWFAGNNLQAAGRFYCNPDIALANIGFRVARPTSNDPLQADRVVTYKQVGDTTLSLHVFLPNDDKGGKDVPARPCIVFFFGGGWVGGSPEQFFPHCRHLASLGMVAISAEYRVKDLHGTTPFACVQDGKSAMRWVRSHAIQLNIDPNRIAAGGGSAGGHVAAATGTVKGFDEPGEATSVSARPTALVLFNPVYDNGPDGYGYERVKSRWREFSPLHNLDARTPPAIVFFGTQDRLIPVATAKEFQRRMRQNGVKSELRLYQGKGHGFFNYRDGKNGFYDETVAAMDEFLRTLGYID